MSTDGIDGDLEALASWLEVGDRHQDRLDQAYTSLRQARRGVARSSGRPGMSPVEGVRKLGVQVASTQRYVAEALVRIRSDDHPDGDQEPGAAAGQVVPPPNPVDVSALDRCGRHWAQGDRYRGPIHTVDTVSGNFVYEENDLPLSGLSVPLGPWRVYNSRAGRRDGLFGWGWSSLFDMSIHPSGEGSVRLTLDDGRVVRITPDTPSFSVESLDQDGPAGEQGWRVTDGRHQWWFTPDGRLRAMERPGATLGLEWGPDGLSVTDERTGRTLEVMITNGRVVSIIDSHDRTSTYRYDAEGDLVVADRPAGRVSYVVQSGLMVAVVDAEGVVEVRNRYDELGRVVEQSRHGSATTQIDCGSAAEPRIFEPIGPAASEEFGIVPGIDITPGESADHVDPDGLRYRIEWDDEGLVRSVGAGPELGQAGLSPTAESMVTVERDVLGHVIGVEGAGSAATVEVDQAGRPVRLTTPDGEETIEYSIAGRPTGGLIGGSNGDGSRWAVTYDGGGRPGTISRTWPDGVRVEVADSYEAGHLTGSVTSVDGQPRIRRHWSHDEAGRIIGFRLDQNTSFKPAGTGPPTWTTMVEIDYDHMVVAGQSGAPGQGSDELATIRLSLHSGRSVAFWRRSRSDRTLALAGPADGADRSHRIDLDLAGRPISTGGRDGPAVRFIHDQAGRPATIEQAGSGDRPEPRTLTTVITTPAGRPARLHATTGPHGARQFQWSYDRTGLTSRTTDADGGLRTVNWRPDSPQSTPARSTAGFTAGFTAGLDWRGAVGEESVSLVESWLARVDPLLIDPVALIRVGSPFDDGDRGDDIVMGQANRVERRRDGLGQIVESRTDGPGGSFSRRLSRDHLGRVKASETSHSGHQAQLELEYHYDTDDGHLLGLVYPNGLTVEADRNSDGTILGYRVGEVDHPAPEGRRFRFDERGRCLVDEEGRLHRYDTEGRLAEVLGVDEVGRRFHYRDDGPQLATVVDDTGPRFEFSYDEAGRISQVGDPIRGRVRIQRDEAGAPTGDRGDDGSATALYRDELGRLSDIMINTADGRDQHVHLVYDDEKRPCVVVFHTGGDSREFPIRWDHNTGDVVGIGSRNFLHHRDHKGHWFTPLVGADSSDGQLTWSTGGFDDPWGFGPTPVVGLGLGGRLTVGRFLFVGDGFYDTRNRFRLNPEPAHPDGARPPDSVADARSGVVIPELDLVEGARDPYRLGWGWNKWVVVQRAARPWRVGSPRPPVEDLCDADVLERAILARSALNPWARLARQIYS